MSCNACRSMIRLRRAHACSRAPIDYRSLDETHRWCAMKCQQFSKQRAPDRQLVFPSPTRLQSTRHRAYSGEHDKCQSLHRRHSGMKKQFCWVSAKLFMSQHLHNVTESILKNWTLTCETKLNFLSVFICVTARVKYEILLKSCSLNASSRLIQGFQQITLDGFSSRFSAKWAC